MTTRIATIDDVSSLVDCRKIQLIDEGEPHCTGIDDELTAYFTEKISDGSLTQYILEIDGQIASTGAVTYFDFPPSINNKSGKVAYIANIYTKAEYRRRGLSTKILDLLKLEAENKNVKRILLCASTQAIPLYEKSGFELVPRWMQILPINNE